MGSQSGRDHWATDGRPLVLSGEPMLQYQPVVDLASGMLLGFEALLRWQHPTQGLILPGLLIPWAEANGDIVALGEWVLQQGCRDAMAWPPSVQLAVNLSIVQLRRGVASRAVEAALEGSGLMADRLTVEVTEHVMSDEYAIRDLRAIAAMGVQLAVDDVGTSWNSFELLRRMAVNTIKIDASFVNGLEAHEGINRMVVETVVHLAHSSGMSTVAEGVETELHARLVREFDSDAAQGYYFAPPLGVRRAAAMASRIGHQFPLEGGGWIDTPDWDAEEPPATEGASGSEKDPVADEDPVADGVTDEDGVADEEPATDGASGSDEDPVADEEGVADEEPATAGGDEPGTSTSTAGVGHQPAHARAKVRRRRPRGPEGR